MATIGQRTKLTGAETCIVAGGVALLRTEAATYALQAGNIRYALSVALVCAAAGSAIHAEKMAERTVSRLTLHSFQG
jgi:hypothetical protein